MTSNALKFSISHGIDLEYLDSVLHLVVSQ